MRVPRHLPGWSDRALALLLAVAAVGQVLAMVHGPQPVAVAWALLATLPVAVRRRWPVAVVVTLSVLGVLHSLLVSEAIPFGADVAALLVAFYSAGAHAPLRRSSLGTLVALAAFWSQDLSAHHPPSEYFASLVLVAGPWLAGIGMRRTREQNRRLVAALAALQRERDARARDAVLAERARIARDLHDVVGHGLSVVALQAQAADAALESDPTRVRAPVAAILATTRTTMVEMRRLVQVLGSEEESRPTVTLAAVPELVATSGLAVDLTLPAEAVDVPAGVGVAAYRIVQEALTNVRRHSAARSASVEVCRHGDLLRLSVRDPGPPLSFDEPGAGTGLAGVRTRAASCGGRADAGPDDGGWLLTAELPCGAPA